MPKLLNIEYMSLSTIEGWPRNPKGHDLDGLEGSISRFGFVVPIIIDERTKKLAAGHGRVDSLREQKDAAQTPPEYVDIRDGEWFVPVVRGVSFNSDTELEAFLIAANQLTISGGWDNQKLAEIFQSLRAEGEQALQGIGFTDTEIDERLAELSKQNEIDLSEFGEVENPAIFYRVIIDGLSLEDANELADSLAQEARVEQYRG